MHLGFRPPIDSDQDFKTIKAILQSPAVPGEFRVRIKTNIVVAKYTNVLRGADEPSALSLVRFMDGELDELDPGFESSKQEAERAEISVLLARLQAYALLLTKFKLEPPPREMILSASLAAAKRVLALGTNYIVEFGNTMAAVVPPPCPDMSILAQSAHAVPKNQSRGLVFACLFLIRFSHPAGGRVGSEGLAADSHVDRAWRLFHHLERGLRCEYVALVGMVEWMGATDPGLVNEGIKACHKMRSRMDDGGETGDIRDVQGFREDCRIAGFLREFWEHPSVDIFRMERALAISSHGGNRAIESISAPYTVYAT